MDVSGTILAHAAARFMGPEQGRFFFARRSGPAPNLVLQERAQREATASATLKRWRLAQIETTRSPQQQKVQQQEPTIAEL
jgi:hypothetical protein